MQFFKFRYELAEENEKEESRRLKRESAYKISLKTTEFNGVGNKRFCFVCETSEGVGSVGLICDRSENLSAVAEDFVKFIDMDATLAPPEEITFNNIQTLLGSADRQGYIEDEDEILERFGLDRLCGRRGIEFGENLINSRAERQELFDGARSKFMNETLIPELERIYMGGKTTCAPGHPVHYIVETDDRDVRRDVYKILLDSLYANNRLSSCRYTFLDFHPDESYSKMSFETIYKISEGGAVVVRYLANKYDDDDDSTVSAEREIIEHICEMAKVYRNKVLTILCLPRECKQTKALFYENLGSMSFVEIREDFIDGATAKAFLKELASKNGVKADKRLTQDIKDDCSYLLPELQLVFDEWYNHKLKTTVFPQYKEVTEVRREVLGAAPKGCAYDELMEMIGLTEAKEVIKKAINYHKIQKLYAEKGVKQDNPAMHMIFTGNPGTAKTTAARLFSRIMKENGLLSKGQIVEVGRGDLVGKYVGWTAQTVQKKFKEASGGVLFIDEAYSLVDGHDGSFGDEAINTIVQEMENHRADVIVIFAGYPDKMESFLEKNPGLRSRIAFHVPFADYTSRELCEIAELISRRGGMKIDNKALDKLEKAFDSARMNNDFGNGRYVRNIFEQAKMSQASRLLEKDVDLLTTDEIITITDEDIVIPEGASNDTRRIGFC